MPEEPLSLSAIDDYILRTEMPVGTSKREATIDAVQSAFWSNPRIGHLTEITEGGCWILALRVLREQCPKSSTTLGALLFPIIMCAEPHFIWEALNQLGRVDPDIQLLAALSLTYEQDKIESLEGFRLLADISPLLTRLRVDSIARSDPGLLPYLKPMLGEVRFAEIENTPTSNWFAEESATLQLKICRLMRLALQAGPSVQTDALHQLHRIFPSLAGGLSVALLHQSRSRGWDFDHLCETLQSLDIDYLIWEPDSRDIHTNRSILLGRHSTLTKLSIDSTDDTYELDAVSLVLDTNPRVPRTPDTDFIAIRVLSCLARRTVPTLSALLYATMIDDDDSCWNDALKALARSDFALLNVVALNLTYSDDVKDVSLGIEVLASCYSCLASLRIAELDRMGMYFMPYIHLGWDPIENYRDGYVPSEAEELDETAKRILYLAEQMRIAYGDGPTAQVAAMKAIYKIDPVVAEAFAIALDTGARQIGQSASHLLEVIALIKGY